MIDQQQLYRKIVLSWLSEYPSLTLQDVLNCADSCNLDTYVIADTYRVLQADIAQAGVRADLLAEQRRRQDRIAQLESEAASLHGQIDSLYTRLESVHAEIARLYSETDDSEGLL